MKLKLDDAGHVVVSDGRPVYVHDDGKEVPFDAPATVAKISQLNGEAKAHRERAEKAETALKPFEGIEDAEAARKALETIKNIDEGKLLSAGKVEEIKAAAKKAAEDQVAAANKAHAEKLATTEKERDQLRADLYGEKVGGSFARSKFIADKIAIPSDLLQARFGQSFEVKDGRIVAKDPNGNPIYSRSKPGELAEFEEAIEILVDAYPQKDHILKGTGSTGDNKRPGNGQGGGAKTMTRAQFNALTPEAQMKAMTVDQVAVTD